MINVSDRFLNEQLKTRSGGERLDIIAYADSTAKNLTPYFVRDSLSRLEWRLEDDLTAFVSPDAQLSLWYDEDLWDWLTDNEPIRVEIYSGFEFEKIRKWWGYIDKDNLRKDSLGIIYVRIYSFIDYLKSIKTSDIFGGVSSPATYMSLNKIMRQIFNYLDIDDYTIKILPLDTYPNATTYVISFLDTTFDTPHATRKGLCRISTHKFYYFDRNKLSLINFDTNFTTITLEIAQYEYNKYYIGLDKWDDETWVLVKGYEKSFWYKNNGLNWVHDTTWVVDELEFFDDDGVSQGTQAISTVNVSGTVYWPMAYSFKKFDRLNYYVIFYNGCGYGPEHVERSMIKVFNATTHTAVKTIYLGDFYMHPDTQAAVSYYLNNDYYFTFLNPDTDFDGNVTALKLWLAGSTWHTLQTTTSYMAAQLDGQLEGLGPYVAIKGTKYAFDVNNNYMYTTFWPYNADGLGEAWRATPADDPYQFLVGYNIGEKKIMMRKLRSDGYLTSYYNYTMPEDYDICVTPTYWRTYENVYNVLGLALDADGDTNIALVGNQFIPFVKKPPLTENENLCDTIRDLAIAGCCVYHFPDNERAMFISRNGYDDTIYTVGPELIIKDWHLITQLPRRIIVSSGDMEVEVGDEYKSLNVSSDYIPDYDDNVGRAYGQAYRDFLDDNPHIIEMDTDFLIQHEPFDTVKIIDREGIEYLGRIIRTVKEGTRVGFEIRGNIL